MPRPSARHSVLCAAPSGHHRCSTLTWGERARRQPRRRARSGRAGAVHRRRAGLSAHLLCSFPRRVSRLLAASRVSSLHMAWLRAVGALVRFMETLWEASLRALELRTCVRAPRASGGPRSTWRTDKRDLRRGVGGVGAWRHRRRTRAESAHHIRCPPVAAVTGNKAIGTLVARKYIALHIISSSISVE